VKYLDGMEDLMESVKTTDDPNTKQIIMCTRYKRSHDVDMRI